jgi:hypothetical protein
MVLGCHILWRHQCIINKSGECLSVIVDDRYFMDSTIKYPWDEKDSMNKVTNIATVMPKIGMREW